jgi:hypothetical protein
MNVETMRDPSVRFDLFDTFGEDLKRIPGESEEKYKERSANRMYEIIDGLKQKYSLDTEKVDKLDKYLKEIKINQMEPIRLWKFKIEGRFWVDIFNIIEP